MMLAYEFVVRRRSLRELWRDLRPSKTIVYDLAVAPAKADTSSLGVGGHVAVLFSLLFLSPLDAEASTQTRVSGASVLVGDVVKGCQGEACAIEVGPSPLPGRTRVVRRREVLAALRSAGFGTDDLMIPIRKRVVRPAKRIPEEELTPRVQDAVTDILPDGIALENLGRVGAMWVPKNGFEVQARWPGERSFRRRISIPIVLVSDGVPFRTLQVAATLQVITRLPVAAADLPKGTLLDGGTVKWAELHLNRPPDQLARTASVVLGRRLVRAVAKDEPFELVDLVKVAVVARGERLDLESIQGLVRIRTAGVARQDGAVGDRIRVLVHSTSRLLWAEVVAPGRAIVVP